MASQRRFTRTKADAADDPNPNTTPPADANVFALKGSRGYRAQLSFDAGETCDVTVWVWDPVAARWGSTLPIVGVEPDQLFGDPGTDSETPHGLIFIQLTNLSAGAEPIVITGESL